MSRRLLEKTLEREDYEVIAVDNGRSALQQLSLPDGARLALLDWMMPELDGPRVCLEVHIIPLGHGLMIDPLTFAWRGAICRAPILKRPTFLRYRSKAFASKP